MEYSFENFTILDKKKNGKVHNRTLPFLGMLHSSTVLFVWAYYFITAFSNATPVRVKPSVAVIVFEQPILVLVIHPHLTVFFILRTHKIVCIDKIVARIIRWVYKDVIFDTSPVAGKGYKNSENRRKQGVSCGFHCICRRSICPVRAQPWCARCWHLSSCADGSGNN